MSSIQLVISDLHLADGDETLDCFGARQQAALQGLLAAASARGPLGQAEDVELIINGDCFDFLVTLLYTTRASIDADTAQGKLDKIIAAHWPFFETLRGFLAEPGRHVTFLTGNHDLELRFAGVRERILEELEGTPGKDVGKVVFCAPRFYRPLSDVYIEHGNHFDFWNHQCAGIWDEAGQAVTLSPDHLALSAGTRYYQHASFLMSKKYPYFDHFEPTMNTMRQIALLCLLDPELIQETAQRTMQLLAQPRPALANLAPGDERVPARLFEQAIIDFAAFEQDMRERKTDWQALDESKTTGAAARIAEFALLRDALELSPLEAISIICTPQVYEMAEEVATGMHGVLKQDSTLRYALAGHSHVTRIDGVSGGLQSYLNTGSWTTRLALPAPGELTPALVEWLRHPDMRNAPLRDVTQFVFALIHAPSPLSVDASTQDLAVEAGAVERFASASLCVWDSEQGNFRVLA